MSEPSTTATGAVPLLTRGTSTTSSTASADTGIASALDGGYVLESRDGVLTVPDRYRPNADLLCPFQVLDCEEAFSDVREFKTHVFAHFKGHNTPDSASCFLCDRKFSQGFEDHPARAWNEMLSHLAVDHFQQGERLATVRTDFALMKWMYCRRIITSAQFKRTQMCTIPTFFPATTGGRGDVVNLPTAPTPPLAPAGPSRLPMRPAANISNDAFFVHASRRAERRRREDTRPMVAAG